jgi:hypothetical protein
MASRVMSCRGRTLRFNKSITSAPAARPTRGFSGVERGHVVEAHRRDAEKFADGRHRIRGELTAARAGTGHAWFSTLRRSASDMRPAACAPTASNTS